MKNKKVLEIAPFKVGDLVKTKFIKNENNIIRKVIQVLFAPSFSSGWCISVDAGEICTCCKRQGTQINGLDSSWVTKI